MSDKKDKADARIELFNMRANGIACIFVSVLFLAIVWGVTWYAGYDFKNPDVMGGCITGTIVSLFGLYTGIHDYFLAQSVLKDLRNKN